VTDPALVARKLAFLELHLGRLSERRPPSPEALDADPLVQDAISMSLLVVVQEAMDIALHIASDEGWELAASYRDAFMVLTRHGVIEPDLAARLGGASHLRNRIAHGYASLDIARLWSDLPAGVADFRRFSTAIASFLKRSEGGPPLEPA
jgi:uncharacterized protein YutE (UPF0331/DUF86 family)